MKFSRVTITTPEPNRLGRRPLDPQSIERKAGACEGGGETHQWADTVHEDTTGRFFWADYQRCLGESPDGLPCIRVRLTRKGKLIGYTGDPITISKKDMARALQKANFGTFEEKTKIRPEVFRDLAKRMKRDPKA